MGWYQPDDGLGLDQVREPSCGEDWSPHLGSSRRREDLAQINVRLVKKLAQQGRQMKSASRSAPLFRAQDSERIRDEIEAIQATGANIFRPTDFQIKVGRLQLLPYDRTNLRSMVKDPAYPRIGIEAFLEMLK